jgi:hypothetical protein
MLYDNYRNRILRYAEILKRILRLVPVYIASAVVLVVFFSFVMTVKGTVTQFNYKNHMEYGSDIEYTAISLFGKARFEYSPKGEDAWSATMPELPGEYDVRVVSNGAFGYKIKNMDPLHIYPKRTKITVSADSVQYGEKPLAEADLGKGDRIECENFIFESYSKAKTKIKADYASVKIFNEAGEDVTFAYEIDTPYCEVNIIPR